MQEHSQGILEVVAESCNTERIRAGYVTSGCVVHTDRFTDIDIELDMAEVQLVVLAPRMYLTPCILRGRVGVTHYLFRVLIFAELRRLSGCDLLLYLEPTNKDTL